MGKILGRDEKYFCLRKIIASYAAKETSLNKIYYEMKKVFSKAFYQFDNSFCFFYFVISLWFFKNNLIKWVLKISTLCSDKY